VNHYQSPPSAQARKEDPLPGPIAERIDDQRKALIGLHSAIDGLLARAERAMRAGSIDSNPFGAPQAPTTAVSAVPTNSLVATDLQRHNELLLSAGLRIDQIAQALEL
jgi:hypothetical protein